MLANWNPEDLHTSKKREDADWYAVFNPKVQRAFNVALVQSTTSSITVLSIVSVSAVMENILLQAATAWLMSLTWSLVKKWPFSRVRMLTRIAISISAASASVQMVSALPLEERISKLRYV